MFQPLSVSVHPARLQRCRAAPFPRPLVLPAPHGDGRSRGGRLEPGVTAGNKPWVGNCRRAFSETVFLEKCLPRCPQSRTQGRDRAHLCSHRCGCVCLAVAQGLWSGLPGARGPLRGVFSSRLYLLLGAESSLGPTDRPQPSFPGGVSAPPPHPAPVPRAKGGWFWVCWSRGRRSSAAWG